MTEDYETALETAKRAVQTNPFDIESNYNFAVCSELMGKVSQAYIFNGVMRKRSYQEKN